MHLYTKAFLGKSLGFMHVLIQGPSIISESMFISSVVAFRSRSSDYKFPPARSINRPCNATHGEYGCEQSWRVVAKSGGKVIMTAGRRFTTLISNMSSRSWMIRAVGSTSGPLNLTRPTRGLLVEASSSASSAGAWTSWRRPRSKASVSTARHSTLKVGCFGKLTCRIGENHLPTLDRVKFVHAPMSSKFSASCIRMVFRSVRFAQCEGCFLFIMLIMVATVVARGPRADRVFCKNWTAHRRNEFLKEFGDYLPLPILLLARRLRTQKRWRRFCMDRDYRRSPKKLLKSYPREYRGKLKALVADIRTLDPEVWHRDWNLKTRHELAFEYDRFLTTWWSLFV